MLSNLISEEDYDFSPNIGVKDWTPCLKSLFEGKGFNLMDQDNSIRNLVTRYEDMSSLLNERIQEDLLKHFIVWLKQNVLFSQIITYSDDDAATAHAPAATAHAPAATGHAPVLERC